MQTENDSSICGATSKASEDGFSRTKATEESEKPRTEGLERLYPKRIEVGTKVEHMIPSGSREIAPDGIVRPPQWGGERIGEYPIQAILIREMNLAGLERAPDGWLSNQRISARVISSLS